MTFLFADESFYSPRALQKKRAGLMPGGASTRPEAWENEKERERLGELVHSPNERKRERERERERDTMDFGLKSTCRPSLGGGYSKTASSSSGVGLCGL